MRITKKSYTNLFCLLSTCSALSLSACANDPGAGPAENELSAATSEAPLFGVGVDGAKYFFEASTPNVVNVCFNGAFLWNGSTVNGVRTGTWTKSNSGFSTEISWIKAAITAQWGANADLTFNYYSSCPSPIPTEYVPVVLLKGYGLGDNGGLGSPGVGSHSPNSDNPGWQGKDRENQISLWVYKGDPLSEHVLKRVAVHEMGHVLGFGHEQDMPYSSDLGRFFTEYDPDSIMHYDRDVDDDGVDAYTSDDNENLTALDKAGAQMAYGFPSPMPPTARNLCTSPTAKLYTGKFNADGRTDIMCNDPAAAVQTVDLADASGKFTNADWMWHGSWCLAANEELLVGDVNADGRDDLLCFSRTGARVTADLAEADGSFPYDNWAVGVNYCSSPSAKLYTGKFNADSRTDIVCNDPSVGLQVDVADGNGQFAAADWTWAGSWCAGADERLLVGDVNGDGRDDLVCTNHANGGIVVDLAEPDGSFPYDSWFGPGNFCIGATESTFLADLDGNGNVDLVCRDSETGYIQIALGQDSGGFTDVKFKGPFAKFCAGSTGAVVTGHFKGTARSDLLCNTSGGIMSVQYSTLPQVY